ncbi:MAG: hypothetical protein M1832_000553 [Thelocarpon impressellum]|nr:MAG: hypothetical protein M1832_000553 [Thelocarpon impressellum]
MDSFPRHSARQARKSKMSVTQTYFLAHQARAKLSSEAAQPDHNLRLLVGHANLLDSLMVELAEAERDQERWFEQTVSGAARDEPRHVQWADSVESDGEESDGEDESASEYDEDDEAIVRSAAPARRAPSPAVAVTVTSREIEDESDGSDEYADDDDHPDLALVRTRSHSSAPELLDDSDEESDDDSMPPSPPQPSFALSDKERHAIATTSYYDADRKSPSRNDSLSPAGRESFFEEGFYLPQRPTAVISAF